MEVQRMQSSMEVDMGQQIDVVPLTPNLGAEIRGADLGTPMDEDTFRRIHTALMEHEVIVFRGQDITAEQQIAFGKRFGAPTVHPFSPNLSELPELIVLDNHKNNPPRLSDVWHSDESFREEPPMGTILRAVITPELGGDTMFASMTAAFEGLSDRMQHFISGLEAVHDFKPFRTLFSGDEASKKKLREMEDMYPNPAHPVVRVHPVTGRKVLFVNPQFTITIKGMSEKESRGILDILFHQAEIPEYQLRHHWEPHTLAFWDNRSTQHYAVHDYYPQRRRMERITLKGDRPFGAGSERAPQEWTRKEDIVADEGDGGNQPVRQFER